MPYSKSHKDQTRQRIVKVASDILRTDGISGTGVAKVMKQAGLTHGGFYAHFKSRDELIAAAFEEAVMDAGKRLSEGLDDLAPSERLNQYIRRYLSRVHRDNPELGCPLAALGSELARGEPGARQGFERGMRRLLKGLDRSLPAEESTQAQKNIATDEDGLKVMAMMVGGLMLSRTVADHDYSDHILRTTRHAALELAQNSKLAGETS